MNPLHRQTDSTAIGLTHYSNRGYLYQRSIIACLPDMPRSLVKIPRFIEHMVSVVPDPAAPEHRRESLALGHLLFGNPFVATLSLANDEFTDLPWVSRSFAQPKPVLLPVARCQ